MWAPSKAGFVVVGSAGKLLCANAEALAILAYPEAPSEVESQQAPFRDRLRGLVAGLRTDRAQSFAEVSSGRRCYRCCVMPLMDSGRDSPAKSTAVLIERKVDGQLALQRLSEEFKLTPRERETVELLAQGLTNKEIAHRMGASTNTVKTFLHLVMTKMEVSSRSVVIAKLFELSQPRG